MPVAVHGFRILWPPKGNRVPSEESARKVVEHLKLCGWDIHRPLPKALPPAERATKLTYRITIQGLA